MIGLAYVWPKTPGQIEKENPLEYNMYQIKQALGCLENITSVAAVSAMAEKKTEKTFPQIIEPHRCQEMCIYLNRIFLSPPSAYNRTMLI